MLFKNDLTKPYVCIRLFFMVLRSMMMKDLWFLFSLIFSATCQWILYIFYLSMAIVLTWDYMYMETVWVVWFRLVLGFSACWRLFCFFFFVLENLSSIEIIKALFWILSLMEEGCEFLEYSCIVECKKDINLSQYQCLVKLAWAWPCNLASKIVIHGNLRWYFFFDR